jgi:hypothetical protein
VPGAAILVPERAERSGKPRFLAAALLLNWARRFILRPMQFKPTSFRGYPPDEITILQKISGSKR